MLKEERFKKILDVLNDKEFITAKELAKNLFVSIPTIRRDLTELEQRELLIRSHGGAIKVSSTNTVAPIKFRKTLNSKIKKQLSTLALSLIKENDIIFIDASTSALQIAHSLPNNYKITVITNSILINSVLTKKNITSYCTGGVLQLNSMCYAGNFAEKFLETFNFDIMFFSSYGVNDKLFIVDTSLPETLLRQVAISKSKKTAFLCDSSKFFQSASYNLLPLIDVDYILTDSKSISKKLKKYKGKVLTI